MEHVKRSKPPNLGQVRQLISRLTELRSAGYDVVERCAALELPLVLRDESSRERALAAALAELEICYQRSQHDFEVVLKSQFGRSIVSQFRGDEGLLTVLAKGAYQSAGRDRIIGVVYPWYNSGLYTNLIRITRETGLDVSAYSYLAGRYRYFRFFPVNSTRFRLMDGQLDIDLDKSDNMICFGQRSMNHTRKGYEHRGFVLPGQDKIDLISFRSGTLRLGSVWGHDLGPISSGIILTATKGSKRPFAARAMIVKEGSSRLYDLVIPKNKDGTAYIARSAEYQEALKEFKKMSSATVFADANFMWGNRAPAY
jgi:hypothetical protein